MSVNYNHSVKDLPMKVSLINKKVNLFRDLFLGNLDKARNAQALHQQMLQFINNPTYETLASAKHIRDILERALVKKNSFLYFQMLLKHKFS